MITDSELEKLADFGKEDSGEYCDRWQFSICPCNKERTEWTLRLFCEVDGSTWHVKYLKDMEDLKNVYHAITNKELVFLKYFSTDGRGFVEEKQCKYYQSILDGEIEECDNCFGSGVILVSKDKVKDTSSIVKHYFFGNRIKIKCECCDGIGHFILNNND